MRTLQSDRRGPAAGLAAASGVSLFVAVLAAPAAAQLDTALHALRERRLGAGLAALHEVRRIDDDARRLEVAEHLVVLAARDRALREPALREALRRLEREVESDADAARRDELIVRGALALDALWANGSPRALAERAGERARLLGEAAAALERRGRGRSRQALDVRLRRLPLLAELKRLRDVLEVGEDALRGPVTEAERRHVRGRIGLALLKIGRPKQAIPHLDDFLRIAPSDPRLVLDVVGSLGSDHAGDALRFLLPVITAPPRQGHRAAWTECLDATYDAWRAAGPRKPPVRALARQRGVRLPLPKQWPGRTWNPGFRLWRPDNAVIGKQYSGAHAIEAILPLSHGWQRRGAPTGELVRWRNAALCFDRPPHGPTVVVYWFGPDVHYWYGHSPRVRGLTGKAARGHSRGGIASLVADVVYARDARKRGVQFTKTRPLPFKPGVRGGVRKAWRRGGTVYDETFFSIGQVTGELLVRIRESDVEALAPELAWLYANVRVR